MIPEPRMVKVVVMKEAENFLCSSCCTIHLEHGERNGKRNVEKLRIGEMGTQKVTATKDWKFMWAVAFHGQQMGVARPVLRRLVTLPVSNKLMFRSRGRRKVRIGVEIWGRHVVVRSNRRSQKKTENDYLKMEEREWADFGRGLCIKWGKHEIHVKMSSILQIKLFMDESLTELGILWQETKRVKYKLLKMQ